MENCNSSFPFRNYALRGNHTAMLHRSSGKSVSLGVCEKNGSSERAFVRTHTRIARKITSADDKSHVSEQKYPRRSDLVARDRGPRLESKLRFLRNAIKQSLSIGPEWKQPTRSSRLLGEPKERHIRRSQITFLTNFFVIRRTRIVEIRTETNKL